MKTWNFSNQQDGDDEVLEKYQSILRMSMVLDIKRTTSTLSTVLRITRHNWLTASKVDGV